MRALFSTWASGTHVSELSFKGMFRSGWLFACSGLRVIGISFSVNFLYHY